MKITAWIWNILIMVDSMWGVIFGYINTDTTISGTVGHFARVKGNRFWKSFEFIIDLAFYPIDGVGHCMQAEDRDPSEDYYCHWPIMLIIFTAPICIIICIPTWIYEVLKYGYNYFKRCF